MPATVTAFSVKIACPGDAAMELVVARDVISRWNALHALAQKRILLPLGEDLAGEEAAHDLLLEFFCGCSTAAAAAEDDAETEIDRQLRDGRPALIYFSRARADLNRAHGSEGSAVPEFQRRHPAATVACYADEKEFRAQFAQHLDNLLGSHPHFRLGAVDSAPACAGSAPEALKVDAPLSDRAKQILFEACDDFEAYVGHSHAGGSLRIQANGKQLVEGQDPQVIAAWENAFRELLDGAYIRDAGFNGQLYQISAKGFEFLKTLGKTPIGYIAELGGM